MFDSLHDFIIEAKTVTYVGSGEKMLSSRTGSHDLGHERSPFCYRDSYFGGTDFVGQEVVWHKDEPVWAMNYFGRIFRDDLMTGADGAKLIRQALTAMYSEGRFLGGFAFDSGDFAYRDASGGDFRNFTGIETISVRGAPAYQLDYHGGLIRP
jgi:hypothetical protein